MGEKQAKKSSEVPESKLESWRTEVGHEAENKVVEVLVGRLGMEPVSSAVMEDPRVKQRLKDKGGGVVRTSAKEDFERGVDFHLFNAITSEWIPVDLTISSDPEVHAKKRARERETGVKVLALPKRTVDLASLGSEREIQKIDDRFVSLVIEDTLEQHEKGRFPLTPRQVDSLRSKLEARQSL